ncbi:MAG: glycosyltransferase [Pirellulaceae bacterium]
MVPFMRANGNRPFFSIVTICRENLSGLRRCVRNIRQQSFDSYEHLVVDSASKDGTAEYLRTQCDDKLSFISEPDDGIYHAINKGISGANGVVVLLLHSDDLLSHGALKRVHDCFAKNNVDAVYGDALYFGKDGRFLQYKPARFYGEEVVLRGMPAAHEAMFIRRSLYEKIGFYDETYRSASDYKLVSHMHLDEVKVAKTYRVELYKLVGGVSFGSDIDRSENFRLLKEHVPAISENLAPKLGSLKNFRTASAVDLCSIYDSISTLNAPSWFFKAISKTLIKILLGDAAEADPDPIRQAPDVFQLRSDKERLLFTIAGLKGVAGGAEKVLVTLVNELKQTTDAEIIVSTAEGRAGFPHYTMDPSIVFIDIYEKPYDELLAANLDLRTELDEIVNRLPEEILFVVSECGKCREHFQSWRQFVKSCRSTSESTAGEIRETLRNEIAVWVRKYGTRVSRWRKLISYYGVASVVAFMISTSTQLFVAIGKTPAKLIISNHGNPIRDYLYQDDWDNSMLDRAIRLFALYSAKNSQWLDDEFLEFIPEPADCNTNAILAVGLDF